MHTLRTRANRQPRRLGYLFLTESGESGLPVTYGELDRRARAIAARLQEEAIPGERALLLYPAGPDFLAAFFGCLYAGIVAVPLYPPKTHRSLGRWVSVSEDSGARLALTQNGHLRELAGRWREDARLGSVRLLATDDLGTSADFYEPAMPSGDELAYLQYTSGSTSTPKGVMVSHENLMYNCAYMREAYALSEETVSVSWVPHFHDLGLIDGLLSPLFTGFPAVVLSSTQFSQRPLTWLEAISEYRATHSGGPNFAYDLCLQKVKPEQRESLDLASWLVAFSGAEPVRKETMEAFAAYFAPCGFRRTAFYPAYGLAEATLMVSGGTPSAGPTYLDVDATSLERGLIRPATTDSAKTRSLVGCGWTRMDVEVAIVDPETRERCAGNTMGEIWVAGPTVAKGYWQRDEENYRTFEARLAGGEGPFLRTGDLGFVHDGHLYIGGRLKDLIIVRGANIYPQDVEWAAQGTHRGLRRGYGAAFGVDVDGEERLVLVQEIDRQLRRATRAELEEIVLAMRLAIALEFDVEAYCIQLLVPGSVPMTSSGKIQRRACRADFLSRTTEVVFESYPPPVIAKSWNSSSTVPIEDRGGRALGPGQLAAMRPKERRRALIEYLRTQVADVLQISAHHVMADQPLGSFGMDSLRGSELKSVLHSNLGVELADTMIWNYPTILEIAGHLAERMGLSLDRDPEAEMTSGRLTSKNGSRSVDGRRHDRTR